MKKVFVAEQQRAKDKQSMGAYVPYFVFIVFVCMCGFLWLSVLFFINDKKPLDGSLTPFFNDS